MGWYERRRVSAECLRSAGGDANGDKYSAARRGCHLGACHQTSRGIDARAGRRSNHAAKAGCPDTQGRR